jgi:hypothetical protein
MIPVTRIHFELWKIRIIYIRVIEARLYFHLAFSLTAINNEKFELGK